MGAPSAARAQISAVVHGSEMYLENGGLPISGTEHLEDFRPDLLGREVIVSFNPVPAGRVTVEIDLSENYYKQPDQRVMAITIDGKNVQARLDIFAAAGGYAKAITESYQVDHEGGRLIVTLTAISDMAKFSTILRALTRRSFTAHPGICAISTLRPLGTRYNAKFAYTSIFKDIDDVVTNAGLGFGAARARSDYIAVKSWSAYVVLDALFTKLGDTQSAAVARAQAALTARTIFSKVDSSTQTLPAVFDGKRQARIIPMIEGLAYPYKMGLTQAVSMRGPYGDLIRALRAHLDNVLKSGVCLDSSSGAWRLSSSSGNTWQSKVYLAQFVAEKILGLTGDRVDGKVDQVHATLQVYDCPTKAWSDQLNSSNGNPLGSLHYPRGITSATCWLDAKSAAGNTR
jgi:hypothetical protein